MKRVLSIFLSFVAFSLNAQSDIQAGKISFNTLDINYGIIKRDSDGTREVTVTNKGNFPLIITSCSATCGCTVPNCPQEPIMPGKSEVIKITYNTHNVGEFSKNVTVYSNDQVNSMSVIKVHGQVIE